jgi:hypothetical protein
MSNRRARAQAIARRSENTMCIKVLPESVAVPIRARGGASVWIGAIPAGPAAEFAGRFLPVPADLKASLTQLAL